ncbi:MAG: hypothetical protein WDA20_09820 [Desulfuromonadales bacterium]
MTAFKQTIFPFFHPALRLGMTPHCFRSGLAALLLVFLLTASGTAQAYIIINAPMTDTNPNGWVLGGTPNSATLTGDGVTDPVGDGWLRLTNNTGNQTGYAYNDTTSFTLQGGLIIQFDYVTWGGNGADGYSIYLFDANVPTFNIGAFGGSLGYAQKLPPTVNPAVPGISGGYIGIGVDEFGNFANPTEGRYLGPGSRPDTVTIRGSVLGFGNGNIGQTTATDSYPWIASSGNSGSLWYNGSPRPSQTGTAYRKVIITITPAPNPVVNVWIQFGYDNAPTQMIFNQALPAIPATQQLKIGYAASTGGSTNYHEIRNLVVTDQYSAAAIDLGITKGAFDQFGQPLSSLALGDSIRYVLTARNYGPSIDAAGVGIVDNLPAGLSAATWTCSATGGASCGSASGSGDLNTTANLPVNGAVTYTIDATLTSLPAGNLLGNTASLIIPGAVSDYNAANDSATVTVGTTATAPASGNKRLYLYPTSNTAGDLSRTVQTNGTSYYINRGNAANRYMQLTLNPALSAALNVDGNIGVRLCMRRTNNGSGAKTVRVQLFDNATAIGTYAEVNWDANGWAWRTFSIPHTGPTRLDAGDPLRLRITNMGTSSTTARHRVDLDPDGSSCGSTNPPSYVEINTSTVINVDSVAFYDTGGNPIGSASPGSTIRIRATVSDPFGSYDINAEPPTTLPKITLIDGDNNLVVNAATMTQVDESVANGTKTFEYSYGPVPSTGGFWTASVRAVEGTENLGTHSEIAHTGVGTFEVVLPQISLTKIVETFSDPVHGTSGPYAIPGAVMRYTIFATNLGRGIADADSVVITDPIPAQTDLVVSGNPVAFFNGAESSGLTFTLANDVAYFDATDNLITPSADGNGVDPAVRKIVANPKGTFLGSDGTAPHPSFSIIFYVRVR